MWYVRILCGAASLAACGDAPMNSGDNVVVVVVNSTGLPDIMVTVRGGDTKITANVPAGSRNGLGTGIGTAGERVMRDDKHDNTEQSHVVEARDLNIFRHL